MLLRIDDVVSGMKKKGSAEGPSATEKLEEA